MEILVDQNYNHHQQKIKYLHQKTITFITHYLRSTLKLSCSVYFDVLFQVSVPILNAYIMFTFEKTKYESGLKAAAILMYYVTPVLNVS